MTDGVLDRFLGDMIEVAVHHVVAGGFFMIEQGTVHLVNGFGVGNQFLQ